MCFAHVGILYVYMRAIWNGAHGMYTRVGMHTCASFIMFPRAHECLCQPRLVFGAGSDCEWL